MSEIENIFEKLDLDIQNSIKSYMASLFKINKEHRLFIELQTKHPELIEAEYVVYPNLNNLIPTKFLNKEGGLHS